MEPGFEILTQYGVLGVWVMYAIVRERWLLRKMEQLSLRFDRERQTWHEEREQFIKEISLIRQEERDVLIKELQKANKKNSK
jgi:tRNA-dihydrouridine synthase|tara:strand:- start:945 stop:1190 length:246 start_codon:yes stop_codon:yes gene_type:complete